MDARVDRACQDIQRSVDALVEAMRLRVLARAQREARERSLATGTIDLHREPKPALGTSLPSPMPAPLITPPDSRTEPLIGSRTPPEGSLGEKKSPGEVPELPIVAPSKSVMQQLHDLLVQLEKRAWWHRRGRGG